MKLRGLAWVVPLALAALALVPISSALSPSPSTGVAPVVHVPPPVSGTVTTCSSTITCVYVFNTTAGVGWANSTGTSYATERMALKLPGEGSASYGLAYATYIAKLTGTYTYWTVGNFVGTDVNSGNVVYGKTNTNYTITCVGHSGRGGGCTYNYTTDNGTILVRFTHQEQTSTSISCTPSYIGVTQKSTCTVTVANDWNVTNVPTGTVRITDGRLGSLSNKGVCTLTNGSCSFTFRPFDNTCGGVSILAQYAGTSAFYRSLAATSVTVYVPGGC